MEKNLDFSFGALLQKHKSKPIQFMAVAAGVRKRLESNIKCRKSSRLTNFDSIRNLPQCDTPLKEPDPLTKEEHRRLQLEKWKEEKQKKKKEDAARKKKPFLVGVAHAPMTFVPPPPITKTVPSSSGRVTRSQSAKIRPGQSKPTKTTTKMSKTESFAPKNATFKAPDLKKMGKFPALVPVSKIKKSKATIVFDPVLPVTKSNSKANLKSEPKIPENNKNMTNKATSHVERRPLRGQGRYVKLASSSSSQSLSSGEKQSPASQKPKSKVKTKTAPKHVQSSSEEITSPVSKTKSKPKISRKSVPSTEGSTSPTLQQPLHKLKTPRKSIVSNCTSTPNNVIPKSESSSEERLRSPKSPVNVPLTPEQIVEEATKNSPFVTLSRGKANARRETKQKIDEGLFEEDASDMDSVDHFRRQLQSEIERMTEMCDTWEKISEQIVLPETVQEMVLGAVGQARLLMSHKLAQFGALVGRCERPEPAQPPVTPADLHGFWDMVFMQIVNVDVRFKKLEELRARNWEEEAPVAPRRRAPPQTRAKPPAKPAASRLRDVIAAARRAKQQQQQEPAAAPEPAPEAERTFEAGFFSVRSPARAPAALTPARPSRPSLLKSVLSSEAKKSANKNRASLAILRASLIGKNIDNDSPRVDMQPLVSLTPINLHATPARSILKPVNVPSAKKSIKVVLFDDSDTETHNASLKTTNNDVSGVGKLEDDIEKPTKEVEKERELKENKPKKKSLIRQDAIDTSPVMTRSRRRSIATPSVTEEIDEKTPKRTSRRKKALQEVEVNIVEEKNYTLKRSSRRRSVAQSSVV